MVNTAHNFEIPEPVARFYGTFQRSIVLSTSADTLCGLNLQQCGAKNRGR